MNLNIGSGPVDLTSSGCWMIVNWGLSKKPDDLLRAGATFVLSCGTQDAQFCRSQLVVILEDSPELRATHGYSGPWSTSTRSVSKYSPLMGTSICSKLVKIKYFLLQIPNPHLACHHADFLLPRSHQKRGSYSCPGSIPRPVLCALACLVSWGICGFCYFL